MRFDLPHLHDLIDRSVRPAEPRGLPGRLRPLVRNGLAALLTFSSVWFAVPLTAHAAEGDQAVSASDGDRDRDRDSEDRDRDSEDRDRDSEIGYWVTQLGSDQYLRRRRASRWLIDAGTDAVPVLVSNLGTGDLESTRRGIEVLHEISLQQPPSEESGAWAALLEIAESGVGSQASRALSAIDEIRQHRDHIARERLAAKEVYVGVAEFVVRATSDQRRIVQIDQDWGGDFEHLQWLRWVQGVRYARVVGEAVKPEVVEQLVRMPDLETITFLEGNVDAELLGRLAEMKQIRDLEFRYVPMGEELSDALVQLPIRSSLSLMGTGMPEDVVEEMRAARPGLQIEHRQGGFLGVSCANDFNICQVNSVISDSAAEQAGLIPGDVIVGIEETEVTRFKELQDAINRHLPGDEITIRYSRGGVVEETTAKLGKQEEKIRGLPQR